MNGHAVAPKQSGEWVARALRWWVLAAAMLLTACNLLGGDDGSPVVAPVIDTQPQDVTVADGQAATFSVAAQGGDLSYQWRRGGADIAGANGSSLQLAAVTIADTGAGLSVVVSNSAGSATSRTATLTVTPVRPTISAPPQAASVVVGASATFSVTARGTLPLAYQWLRDGAEIAGATAASYTTPATVLADDGALFSVRLTNVAGSVTSAAAALGVALAAPVASSPRIYAGGRVGVGFSAARTASGSMWVWGANLRGAVGDGSNTNRALPFAWSTVSGIDAISLGSEMTMASDASGSAFWAGASSNGQNGIATFNDLLTPTQVTAQSNLVAIAVGNGYTVAARADGTVWGWGALPTGVRTSSAVQLSGFTGITSLCVAEESILALKKDGTVWFAGADRAGAMPGQGRNIASAITTALAVPGLDRIQQIACGLGQPTAFGLALRNDGAVFSWGDAGGLGYAIPAGQFVQLSPRQVDSLVDVGWIAASNTGLTAAFAVAKDGSVYSWGFDNSGSLALGTISSSTKIEVPTLSTAIGDVVEAATSGQHSLFVKKDGSVWALGSNATGQLGNTSPAAVGGSVQPVLVTGLNLN